MISRILPCIKKKKTQAINKRKQEKHYNPSIHELMNTDMH